MFSQPGARVNWPLSALIPQTFPLHLPCPDALPARGTLHLRAKSPEHRGTHVEAPLRRRPRAADKRRRGPAGRMAMAGLNSPAQGDRTPRRSGFGKIDPPFRPRHARQPQRRDARWGGRAGRGPDSPDLKCAPAAAAARCRRRTANSSSWRRRRSSGRAGPAPPSGRSRRCRRRPGTGSGGCSSWSPG